jgi:RNA-directed DNA polymerase
MLNPAPHIFRSQLARQSFHPEYVEKLCAQFEALRSHSVPVVFTLMHLSILSGTRWEALRAVVKRTTPEADYKVYPKRKRQGGLRWISVPTHQLHATQTWIANNILKSGGAAALLHPAATAYAEGHSTFKNAEQHAGAPWIVRIDIQSFFESISERQVYYAFRRLGYCALLSFEMARLCTRVVPSSEAKQRKRDDQLRWKGKERSSEIGPYPTLAIGHLPQGAPTSPMLSNLVMAPIDAHIQAMAEKYAAVYTRYADDLIFSFSSGPKGQAEVVLSSVRRILGNYGFVLNRKKTRILGPGARKIVTGLLVDRERPRLPRPFKAHLSAAVYHLEKHGVADCSLRMGSKHPLSYLDHLAGQLQYAYSIEPDFARAMLDRIEAVMNREHQLIDLLKTFGPFGKTNLTR